VARSHK